MFIKSRIYLDDEYVVMTRNYFLQYTQLEILEFRDTLMQHMESVKKSIDERAQHKREYDIRMNDRHMQTIEENVDTSKALDVSLVDIESNGTESKEQDTSSRSRNDAHANDEDIKPIYDEEPMAKVQTTGEINVFTTGQQHTEQPKFNKEGEVDPYAEQYHDTCHLPARLTDNQTTELLNQSLESKNISLKNELRKLIGNSVNTKFAKSSILGKLVLQPHRNQSVVRKSTTFKSERPRISKPRFASQVNVINDLSKLVTTHYLPKERESAVVKPRHVIASSESRNSLKNMPRFNSNDMVHNHYLEEAKKKTQERGRNSRPSMMPSARSQSTANSSKPKPRINNQKSRNWPTSKTSYIKTKIVPIAEHSRNSRNFSDSRHFVPSNKTTNRNKPVEKISVAKKPERQIQKGHRFSIKMTSVMHEKTMTSRSCLRWKSTGKIFKYVGLRWVPTGKIFTSSTTKVDSEPTNGSDEDITNQYEYEQTLDVSVGDSSKLNLPDHRIHIKMEMETPHSSRVKFTTTCSYSSYKDIL
ncbi:hypothetical protein Tco_0448220 [Tanacetum coccineum]